MPQRPTRLTVEADGGSRGNPGPAGYGALVREGSLVLAERAGAIGIATNNVAEYRGLIAGLEAARELDPAAIVDVRMDSKLVVEQMSGRWKIKHSDMRVLAAEAAQLVAGFPEVTFSWIPRAQNSAADALANAAMDAAAAGKRWSPPVDLPVSGGAEVSPADEDVAGREDDLFSAVEAGAAPAAPAARTHGLGSGWGRPSGSPTETVLLRHGQTLLSVDGRFSGIGSDPVLTDEGRAQARRAGERLAGQSFDAVISSPLRRAAESARLAGGGREVVVVDGLRETDFGAWEGLTFREVSAQWPDELQAWLADPAVAPPGGESFEQTDLRVSAALAELVASYPGQRLLVVSHVTPIKLLIRRALQAPMSSLYRLHLELASVSTIDWYPDGPAVVRAVNA